MLIGSLALLGVSCACLIVTLCFAGVTWKPAGLLAGVSIGSIGCFDGVTWWNIWGLPREEWAAPGYAGCSGSEPDQIKSIFSK